MNENFYPESEEILFTNRERELETLEFYLRRISKRNKGERMHLRTEENRKDDTDKGIREET